MISYELAVKLKEAGFYPNRGETLNDFIGKNYSLDRNDFVYRPTLSELIEACGDRFKCVGREAVNPLSWYAVQFRNGRPSFTGSSPEEAVTNLWLELQKNK